MYRIDPYPNQAAPRLRLLSIIALVGSVSSYACSSGPKDLHRTVIVPKLDSAGVPGGITFGVGAQSSFQSGWAGDLDNAWDNAWGFWDTANATMNGRWAYNLSGGRGWWESPWSGFSDNVNSVQLFYGVTHGNVSTNPVTAIYAMWDYRTCAYTINMPLDYTEGFFTWACDTHKDNGHVWDNWYPVFSAGLRIATGAYGILTDSYFTQDSGSNFAGGMAYGYTIATSWPDAVHSTWLTQYPSVMVAGTDPSNCSQRLYNMTLYNRLNFAKLTGGQITWLCWYHVQN